MNEVIATAFYDELEKLAASVTPLPLKLLLARGDENTRARRFYASRVQEVNAIKRTIDDSLDNKPRPTSRKGRIASLRRVERGSVKARIRLPSRPKRTSIIDMLNRPSKPPSAKAIEFNKRIGSAHVYVPGLNTSAPYSDVPQSSKRPTRLRRDARVKKEYLDSILADYPPGRRSVRASLPEEIRNPAAPRAMAPRAAPRAARGAASTAAPRAARGAASTAAPTAAPRAAPTAAPRAASTAVASLGDVVSKFNWKHGAGVGLGLGALGLGAYAYNRRKERN